VQTAILAHMRHVQRFYFIKNPPVENHVQITIAHGHMCIFNIQNMPLKPQNKILIHHIQTKRIHENIYAQNLVQNIISAHASCARFFLKKIRPWKIM
jgi:hypothetical protein